jgi:hypothetical protein
MPLTYTIRQNLLNWLMGFEKNGLRATSILWYLAMLADGLAVVSFL